MSGPERPKLGRGYPKTTTTPILGAGVRTSSKWRRDRDDLRTPPQTWMG
jgi:hypothetical protein